MIKLRVMVMYFLFSFLQLLMKILYTDNIFIRKVNMQLLLTCNLEITERGFGTSLHVQNEKDISTSCTQDKRVAGYALML